MLSRVTLKMYSVYSRVANLTMYDVLRYAINSVHSVITS